MNYVLYLHKNKFSMWKKKKYWDNFSIFLGKITNWWEHNFSKVINTSSIQLMVLYLIKIVSNHRWAKIKEKIHFFGKKNSWKWNWFIPMQSFGIIVSKLFNALFYWFLAYCIFSLTNSTYGKFYEKNMNQFHEFFLKKKSSKGTLQSHENLCTPINQIDWSGLMLGTSIEFLKFDKAHEAKNT